MKAPDQPLPQPPLVPAGADPGSAQEKFEKLARDYGLAAQENRFAEAEQIALEMLLAAGEEAARNPPPEAPLWEKVSALENSGDWAGVEAVRRELVAVAEAGGRAGIIAKARQDLSELLLFLGRPGEAWEEARGATAAGRPAGLEILDVMLLLNEAACALEMGQTQAALDTVEEAMGLLQEQPLTSLLRARALNQRARCRLAQGRLSDAATDLAASEQLLAGKGACEFAAGVQATLAAWWEIRATLYGKQGAWAEALPAWQKAVEKRQLVASLPQVGSPRRFVPLARALQQCACAARRLGFEPEAETLAAEARAIAAQCPGRPPLKDSE